MRYFVLFGIFLLLNANNAFALTKDETKEVTAFLKAWEPPPASRTKDTEFPWLLIKEYPSKLAKTMAKKKDYKLNSLDFGYNARKEKAQIVGVKCGEPVEVRYLIYGCNLPPRAFIKLLQQYNHEMIQQSHYPHKKTCQVEPNMDTK